MVACRRMRLRRRDSGFRRNGRRGRRQLKEFPFPRKRESRGAASSATHRRQATLVSASRNFPLTREEIPAFAGMERGAGMEDGGRRQLKEFPFWRKPESHSRISENFPRSGTLQWSPSANAASPQRFRLSPEWKTGAASIKIIPIPAKAGISRGGIVRHASPTGDIGFRFAEFPADAGMERGAGMEDGGGVN